MHFPQGEPKEASHPCKKFNEHDDLFIFRMIFFLVTFVKFIFIFFKSTYTNAWKSKILIVKFLNF
jgi:hypothetical protein